MKTDLYINNGVKRKIKHCTRSMSTADYYAAGEHYIKHIQEEKYTAIVVDFDKTIHNKHINTETEIQIRTFLNYLLENGITIGVATGNGEYITEKLRGYFNKKYHSKIIIGFYNGGVITPLDKDFIIDGNTTIPLDFELVKDFFKAEIPDGYIHEEGLWIERNPYELNFYTINDNDEYYLDLLKTFIKTNTDLKILQSPHSIDVIPSWISKLDVCKYLNFQGFRQSEILTIGDRGDRNESDYELLCRDYSLSVNTVSNAYNSCWNFAHADLSELEATRFYCQHIKVYKGYFTIFENS